MEATGSCCYLPTPPATPAPHPAAALMDTSPLRNHDRQRQKNSGRPPPCHPHPCPCSQPTSSFQLLGSPENTEEMRGKVPILGDLKGATEYVDKKNMTMSKYSLRPEPTTTAVGNKICTCRETFEGTMARKGFVRAGFCGCSTLRVGVRAEGTGHVEECQATWSYEHIHKQCEDFALPRAVAP